MLYLEQVVVLKWNWRACDEEQQQRHRWEDLDFHSSEKKILGREIDERERTNIPHEMRSLFVQVPSGWVTGADY